LQEGNGDGMAICSEKTSKTSQEKPFFGQLMVKEKEEDKKQHDEELPKQLGNPGE
jgi:hypothetical protein